MLTETPGKLQRRSIRLYGYDYSRAGAYFVTICSWGRRSLFGKIVNGEMRLNAVGRIVEDEWLRTPRIRPQVQLDQYQVMPNHLHGIVLIGDVLRGDTRAPADGGRMQDAPTGGPSSEQSRQRRPPSQTVGAIVRGFKGAATNRIATLLRNPRVVVWQRNYFEHIIRDDDDLARVREYIANNPARWAEDAENPEKCSTRLKER